MLPLKVAELDHVVLRCLDRERTLDFYTRVLGMTEEHRLERLGLIQLRAGISMLDLMPAERRDETGRNLEHFCLGIETADMDAVERCLRASGMGVSLYVRDPEGNIVELKQVLPA